MILARYNYRYALLPKDVAKNIGLGWRKTDKNNMVMINLSELKQLPGEGTIEERVSAAGGQIMTPEEAAYYSKTNTFTLHKSEEKPEIPKKENQGTNPPGDPVPQDSVIPLEPIQPQGPETPQEHVQSEAPPVDEPTKPNVEKEQTQQNIQTDKSKTL